MSAEKQYFTAVFECDIRKMKGNPFLAGSPFGRPCAVRVGDTLREREALQERVRVLEDALRLAFDRMSHMGDLVDQDTSEEFEKTKRAFEVIRTALSEPQP